MALSSLEILLLASELMHLKAFASFFFAVALFGILMLIVVKPKD